MLKKSLLLAAAAGALVSGWAGAAAARDQIRMVGSSTVFPFATAVAEEFGRSTGKKTPIVESTGTGGGMKLFCAGVGTEHPDITNASRRMKKSEAELCAKNGITEVTEVKIGFDGIVFANSKKTQKYSLSLKDIFLALAKEIPQGGQWVANPNTTWKQVNPALPDAKIEVYGPPPTSGTRDSFNELAIEGGCKTFAQAQALKTKDEKAYEAKCRTIRTDGYYIEAGENDNLIVQKLAANPNAFGVFGFSYLEENADKIQGAALEGVADTRENISDGKYPLSRALFFYVKNAHVDVIPGIREYVKEFTSEKAWGDDGYLADKGMIPLPKKEREASAAIAVGLKPLDVSVLK